MGILATQPGGVCRDEGYIPLGGLDKTLVVNDVLYLEVSNSLFDRKSKENEVLVVKPVNR